ncbi:hypothetical protein [Pengzhenrongella frigida]|uniref:Uncharacterized protein n=1 Tax=Pengzhenrongella frigida TaxID=1259133 RepID=A0A4Q5MWF9_9MICO|nr:hypothetical protein [Cellulomonas sp. HLT2-17]RYV49928.1 hypothetical protein EUA98_16300 [Cellulomonas sp. HLT2-17]
MAALRRKKPGRDVAPPPAPAPEPHPRHTPVIDAALEKAVTIPSATIHAHVQALRRRNPYASPAQIIGLLEREYLLVIAGAGGAVGAAAAAPAIGTGVAMALTVSDVATFFASSAAFSLAVASVHGIEVQDTGRRRALLLATIVGETSIVVSADVELTSGAFARAMLTRMPTSTIARVNRALTQRMIRRQAARQSALAFGRLAPFGIGAVIGITGARALGRTVISGARRAFGPAPDHFPRLVEVIETGDVPRVIPASALPPYPPDGNPHPDAGPGWAGNGLRH